MIATKVRALIFVCFAMHPLYSQQAAGIEVKVHVADSVTGTAIAGATVTLSQSDALISGQTDATGVFTGRPSLGSALLVVGRHGYRMIGLGLGQQVEVKAGAGNEIAVQMLPLGIIAGRALDQYGDPLRNAIVHAMDAMTGPGGDRVFQSLSAAITDDRGEYRIAEVEPGKHYLAVEFNSTVAERDAGIRSTFRWPLTGGLLFFPEAADIEQAQQVEVAGGATLRVADIRLTVQRAVTVSGKVVSPPLNGPTLSLKRAIELPLHSSPLVQGVEVKADGSFSFEALPGKYILNAYDKAGKVSKPVPLDLEDKDVTGLEVALTSGYEIHGRMVVDGPEHVDFGKLFLNFGGAQIKVDSSGSFQTNLFDGKGRYSLQQLPSGWFVEKFAVAGKSIEGEEFSVETGVTDMVLTLSPHGANVTIHPTGAGADAVALVALLKDSGVLPRPESNPIAQTDGSGLFTIQSVPPGDYRVFMLDAASYVLVMGPDILRDQYKALVPLIHVGADERKDLSLPVVKLQPE